MSGKLAPDKLNPVPVTLAELTVTAAVPVEDNVIDWVAGFLSTTLPNEIDVALTLSFPCPDGDNCRGNVALAPPPVAISVAVCVELTAETVAENPALAAFAGTITLAGTATAVLLLARLTLSPPVGAAAAKVTVQASDPEPAMEPAAHETALTAGVATPAALMFTTRLPCEELLVIVRTPVYVLTCGAENCSVKVAC